jgi:hypothetical protein
VQDPRVLSNPSAFAPVPGRAIVRRGHPLTRRARPSLVDLLAFPYAQVVMLPTRVLKPILAARGRAATPPFPAIE